MCMGIFAKLRFARCVRLLRVGDALLLAGLLFLLLLGKDAFALKQVTLKGSYLLV
jgi:hypothetical protein